MKEIKKHAVAIFDENDKLLRVEVTEVKLTKVESSAIKAAKTYAGKDFEKVGKEKPAPVVLDVHSVGQEIKGKLKPNKTKS